MNRSEIMRRITILDTTLRDGDQAAGFAFRADKKLELALALSEAGVDIIETGFPLSSSRDFETCRLIARELAGQGSPLTAVLCRSIREEIRESAKVFEGGIPGILHLSLPVSAIHISAKLGKTEKEILAMVKDSVSYGAGLVPWVELGAEDATRADPEFLIDYCETALEAGAHTVNIADTLGLAAPEEMQALIELLIRRIPRFAETAGSGGRPPAVLSVHCHNDLGLACANTLAAIKAGCGQAELSVSGIGERAGNAALEEAAANLAARPELYRAHTGIRPEKLGALISLAAEMAATCGSLMKPLSGWNTRAHSSGIHQQGLARNTETYSLPVMETWSAAPERIVLSRHSGQAGVALFARRYCGITLDEETIAKIVSRIKDSREETTGLTEFLCILSDIGKLPPEFPDPLVYTNFEEIRIYGESGEAETVLKTVRKLTGFELRLGKLGVNGCGERLRLYVELAVPRGSSEDPWSLKETYCIERIGKTPALLLFQCCLDAVNGARMKLHAIT
jgi:2-isopropylmalate synthase